MVYKMLVSFVQKLQSRHCCTMDSKMMSPFAIRLCTIDCVKI